MEGAKKDMGDQMRKVYDQVVDVAAVLCASALFEPHLEASVHRKEEFGCEFFIKVLPGLET